MMLKIIQGLTIFALVMFIACCSFWIMRGAGRYQVMILPDGSGMYRIDNLRGRAQLVSPTGRVISRNLREE